MTKKIFHFKSVFLIMVFVLLITGSVRPAAIEAVIARPVQYTVISSSELNTPQSWTVSVSGGTVYVAIRDEALENGTNASLTIDNPSISEISKWTTFSSHTASMSADISKLGDGEYKLVIYKAQSLSNNTVWSFANYILTVNGGNAYFTSSAGRSEKPAGSRSRWSP